MSLKYVSLSAPSMLPPIRIHVCMYIVHCSEWTTFKKYIPVGGIELALGCIYVLYCVHMHMPIVHTYSVHYIICVCTCTLQGSIRDKYFRDEGDIQSFFDVLCTYAMFCVTSITLALLVWGTVVGDSFQQGHFLEVYSLHVIHHSNRTSVSLLEQ